MKIKLLTILSIAFIVTLFTSCESELITPQGNGSSAAAATNPLYTPTTSGGVNPLHD
ncbi:MAG: hypothetical protein WAU36_00785 [Cyclobacteriaceae bacterium]